MTVVLGAAMFAAGALPATAEPLMRASELSGYCKAKPGTRGDGMCDGFIRGVVDGITGDHAIAEQGIAFCIPPEVDTAAVRRTVLAFIAKNPKVLADDAGPVVEFAIIGGYRCPKPTK